MRREDIPHLLRHFLARFCAEENRPITGISGEAMARLSQLDWPGNIRQLENAVYRAVVMSEGDQLGLADFPQAQSHHRRRMNRKIIPPSRSRSSRLSLDRARAGFR